MQKRVLLFVLFLIPGLAFSQSKLPLDRQAALDGSYAGISQRELNTIQAQIAQGKVDPKAAAKQIQYDQDSVQQSRARWANTPYKTNFEQAFNAELARAAAPKTPAQPTRPRPVPVSQPIELAWWVKAVLVVGGYWVSKKLWAKPAGSSQAGNPRAIPLELSGAEQNRLAAAERQRNETLAAIDAKDQAMRGNIRGVQVQLATAAAQARLQAHQLETSAVRALNEAVPDFAAQAAGEERRFPVAMAPWTDSVWKEIAASPRPETPWNVCIAHVKEKTFNGEQGIVVPKTVRLLAAKGPIIVRTDNASKERGRAVIHNLLLRAAIGAPAEVRFSLLDPFGMGAGFPMRRLLPRVRPSSFTAADELAGVMEEIRRINEHVVGQADSFAKLTREQRAGELYEIIAVLDYPNEYKRDPRALDYIAHIGQSGSRAGRYMILEWSGAPSAADMAIFENAEIIDVAGAPAETQFDPVAPPEMRETLLQAVNKMKSESTGGDWNSLVRPARFFSESAQKMIGTPVGERLNMWFGENQDGKPCAHGMLAGQTGSGKSFLLHTFITGLVARYSPDELQLVLVDGKQGVEFEAYRTLPHAQVVCLRTSPAVARSVLEDFVAEMDDRWEKFQRNGVQKLEDYRKTGQKMPRMLMVVDEYQQLLEGDSDRGSQLLSKVLEKGRAAGIHLLLGSQTFEVRGLAGAAMTHVHLRVTLSLAGDYIQMMNAFGPEGKKLIRELAPRGQVVINDEAGRDGANHRGAVARLEDASGPALQRIVSELTDAAGGPGTPVVLSGRDAAVLADNLFVEQWRSGPPDPALLQGVARKQVRDGGFGVTAWNQAERPVPLWLGRKFDVRGHMLAVLKRGPGQNLLAVGSDGGVRLCMLANALAALRSMRSMRGAEILFLDGLAEGQAGEGTLCAGLAVLQEAGAHVEHARREGAAAALDAFAASAMQLKDAESVRLLIASEPEHIPALAGPTGYGSAPSGTAGVFRDLLRSGPAAGVHSIVTASGLSVLSGVFSANRELSLFHHRVSQQTSDDESGILFSKNFAGQIQAQTDHHMGAVYMDVLQGTRSAQLFKAYAATPALHGDQSAEGLAEALRSLYPAERQGVAAP